MKKLVLCSLIALVCGSLAQANPTCSEILTLKNRFDDPVLKDIFDQLSFARQAIRDNKHQDAIEWVQEVLRLDRSNAEAHGLLAIALQAQGRVPEAMASFRQSFDLLGGHPRIFEALNRFYRENNRSQDQLQIIETMIGKEPGNATYVIRKVTWHLRDNDPQSARDALAPILQAHPNNVSVLNAHFRVLKAEGKLEKALGVLDTIASKLPETNRRLEIERIELLGRLEKYEFQLQALNRLIEFDSSIVGLRRRKVAVLIELGRFEQALTALKDVQSNNAALKLEAQLNYHLGRMDKAYEILKAMARDLNEVDVFVIAALMKIEKSDIPMSQFQPSPFLEAALRTLNTREVVELSNLQDAIFWSFKAQGPMEASSPIRNSFWENTAYFRSPINGQATGELVGQSNTF